MTADIQQRAVFLHLPKARPIDIEFKGITYTVPIGRKKGELY